MNWYKKVAQKCSDCSRTITAAWGHCLDRLDGRLAPFANELRQAVDAAENIYGRSGRSVAVCVKELPSMMAMNKTDDTSNGDWVVIILRPRGMGSECKTAMLRRSPDRKKAPQPFTADALRVDQVVRYQQFLADIQKVYAEPAKKPMKTPTVPATPKPANPSLPV